MMGAAVEIQVLRDVHGSQQTLDALSRYFPKFEWEAAGAFYIRGMSQLDSRVYIEVVAGSEHAWMATANMEEVDYETGEIRVISRSRTEDVSAVESAALALGELYMHLFDMLETIENVLEDNDLEV